MSIIILDVGGSLFKTTKETLCKSAYFETLLSENWEGSNSEPIFIDQSPKLFKHVLCFLRDPKYRYPTKYQYLLDFYLIKYTPENLYDESESIIEILKIVNYNIGKSKISESNHENFCITRGCIELQMENVKTIYNSNSNSDSYSRYIYCEACLEKNMEDLDQ